MEAKGGAQVRRLQILYFLSRNGHNEHPHLIRIHHLSNTGVRLRGMYMFSLFFSHYMNNI